MKVTFRTGMKSHGKIKNFGTQMSSTQAACECAVAAIIFASRTKQWQWFDLTVKEIAHMS